MVKHVIFLVIFVISQANISKADFIFKAVGWGAVTTCSNSQTSSVAFQASPNYSYKTTQSSKPNPPNSCTWYKVGAWKCVAGKWEWLTGTGGLLWTDSKGNVEYDYVADYNTISIDHKPSMVCNNCSEQKSALEEECGGAGNVIDWNDEYCRGKCANLCEIEYKSKIVECGCRSNIDWYNFETCEGACKQSESGENYIFKAAGWGSELPCYSSQTDSVYLQKSPYYEYKYTQNYKLNPPHSCTWYMVGAWECDGGQWKWLTGTGGLLWTDSKSNVEYDHIMDYNSIHIGNIPSIACDKCTKQRMALEAHCCGAKNIAYWNEETCEGQCKVCDDECRKLNLGQPDCF